MIHNPLLLNSNVKTSKQPSCELNLQNICECEYREHIERLSLIVQFPVSTVWNTPGEAQLLPLNGRDQNTWKIKENSDHTSGKNGKECFWRYTNHTCTTQEGSGNSHVVVYRSTSREIHMKKTRTEGLSIRNLFFTVTANNDVMGVLNLSGKALSCTEMEFYRQMRTK